MSTPILYTFRRCPYAIRARMALAAAKITFEIREVVLKDKPPELLDISPKGTVPVLVLGECIIEESLEIMQWALQNSQESFEWLNFAEGVDKKIFALIKENDGEFKYNLDRYKYPQRYDVEPLSYRESGERFLSKLETLLKENIFLLGDEISLADIAIFPFIRQFVKVDQKWFDSQAYPYLHKWLEFHLQSNLFSSVMKKYSQWQIGSEPIWFAGGM